MEEQNKEREIKERMGERKMPDCKKDNWGKKEVVYWYACNILVFIQNIISIRLNLNWTVLSIALNRTDVVLTQHLKNLKEKKREKNGLSCLPLFKQQPSMKHLICSATEM